MSGEATATPECGPNDVTRNCTVQRIQGELGIIGRGAAATQASMSGLTTMGEIGLGVVRDIVYLIALFAGIIGVTSLFKGNPDWSRVRAALLGAVMLGGIGFAIGFAIQAPIPLWY